MVLRPICYAMPHLRKLIVFLYIDHLDVVVLYRKCAIYEHNEDVVQVLFYNWPHCPRFAICLTCYLRLA